MLAIVNPRCDYGKGLRTWQRLEPTLRARYSGLVVEDTLALEALPRRIGRALADGERRFIAAGGDGTVNSVANALLETDHDGATLGAVGLGSSNDFHKPFQRTAMLRKVHAKLQWAAATPRDVILVRYRDGDGEMVRRACLINAGIGITAHANAIYNRHLPVISMLQRISVEAAILASAVHALRTFTSIRCEVSLDDAPSARLPLTNLAVLKNAHVGGALCYDTPVGPCDGTMVANLCIGMSTKETVETLLNLYRCRFEGRPKTSSHTATTLTISSDERFALEMDGEVVHTCEVRFELAAGALRCCP